MKVSKAKNIITLSKKDTKRWETDASFRDEVCILAAELLKEQNPEPSKELCVVVYHTPKVRPSRGQYPCPLASFYVRLRATYV